MIAAVWESEKYETSKNCQKNTSITTSTVYKMMLLREARLMELPLPHEMGPGPFVMSSQAILGPRGLPSPPSLPTDRGRRPRHTFHAPQPDSPCPPVAWYAGKVVT